MLLPVGDQGDRQLNATLLISSPVSFEAFMDSILNAPNTGTPDRMVTMKHLHAENLKTWANPDEVMEYLTANISKVAKKLNSATCTVGFLSSEEDRDQYAPPYVWPCVGCSTPLIAGGHHHEGDPPPMRMSNTWGQLHHAVHHAISLMETVVSILCWRDERLTAVQDLLIEELLKAPRDGRPLSEHTIEALGRGVPHMDAGFLLGNLVGVTDNCLSVCPKGAYLATALCGLLMSKRPACCLETLDPRPLSFALYKFLSKMADSLMNPGCSVDCWFAASFLLNSVPLLYHLGDWKEASKGGFLQAALLPSSIGSLAVNLLHTASQSDMNMDIPLPFDKYPELGRINLTVGNIFLEAGDSVAAALRSNPLLFTAVALIEVIGRWQWRGVACMEARVPTRPTKEIIQRMNLNEKQIRNYTEAMSESFTEYVPRLKEVIVDGKPSEVFKYIIPIFEALARGEQKPPMPSSVLGESLLRSSLSYSSQCCSLPGCTRKKRGEESEPLLLCSGGCKGLARYCCKEHQVQDWKMHKNFCKRQE